MANKQLTASVRLNTTQAEQKLRSLARAIDSINNAAKKQSNAYNGVNNALSKASKQTDNVTSKTKQWAQAQRQVGSGLKSNNNLLRNIGNKLKLIGATYIGIMGAKAVAQTSDTITSAKNRLNNLEGATPESTALALDKMYVAAQNSRSNYGNMLSNVSKTMTLAGDSFDNNIDNAIRFQEIMAKAYTVGGASEEEASSSMYQLVQALGSGVLQGDELRSVREGAPVAYKEIEKFAQKVFDTEDSLKDLASQGVITSDIVVAAIMDAGGKIDGQFENTKMTFQQAANSIKNMAMKAFTPVLDMLNDALNSDAGKAILNGIGKAFVLVGNILLWLGDIVGNVINWIADNWSWLRYIVVAGIIVLAGYLTYLAGVALWEAAVSIGGWIAKHWAMMLYIAAIVLVVAAILWLANSTGSGVQFMVTALLLLGAVILAIGILTGNVALMVIGGILVVVGILVAALARYGEEIVGGIYWIWEVIKNVGKGIANFFVALANWLVALFHNCISGIVNFFTALWNVVCAITKNIGIAFENGWIHAQNTFWKFIEAVLNGIKFLEPAINAIAKAFGAEGFTLSGVIENVSNKQKSTKSYESVSGAWSSGMSTRSYESLGNAWSSGMSTFSYGDLGDAYNRGAKVGGKVENWLEKTGDKVKDALSFDNLSKTLGLDGDLLNGIGSKDGSYLPGLEDPAYQLSDIGYDPDKLANIDKNVGDMKDSMDLTNDDMEYLRKIAEMEWRNEFTTAEIKVDMTNNNTVNGERDLDGIVEYLSDVLRSEMTNVAYGVHY